MKSMKTQIILQVILVDDLFFQIFKFIGSSVINLSFEQDLHMDSQAAIRVNHLN